MNILIAGGAGFLGSHLCERLLDEGHAIVCVDNFRTGSKDNIKHLMSNSRFTLKEWDIREPLHLPQFKPDRIFNLACPASPPHYQKDHLYTLDTSYLGTRNLLELAKQTGARFFQASTSEVYGDPSVHPQPESYWGNVNSYGERSCYDEGKRAAETLCYSYRKLGVDVRIVRIFNTYGPHMDPYDGRVVSNFIVQALQGKPLTIYGNGQQTRSFCYVSDLVTSIIKLMESVISDPVNLGNPGEFTIKELAELVIKKVNNTSTLVQHPLPKDDPKQRKPDITKAMKELGWQPLVPLDEGLDHTIAYFKKRLSLNKNT